MHDIPDLGDIRLTDRPLAVFDVDDVVLQFIMPFIAYLDSRDLVLLPRSFNLHGNILRAVSQEPVGGEEIQEAILHFFETQEAWQSPVAEAGETLGRLAKTADIVFLTAMPPRYMAQRRRLLDTFGLTYPLIATESPKGPVVKMLHRERPLPLAFVDDMVRNLQSVADSAPESLRLHMIPDSELHRHAPRAPETLAKVCNWNEAGHLLDAHFSKH